MDSTLDSVVAALQAHLNSSELILSGFKYPVEAVICGDGTRFSVQASEYTYCTPRNNQGPWVNVEVMTLTEGAIPTHWQQDESCIGAYVPIDAVAREIVDRGYLALT